MSKFIGRLVELGIAKETVRGTGASPAMWLPKVELALQDRVEEARDEASIGKIADSLGKEILEKYSGGTMKGQIRDQTFGYMLLAALGGVSSSGSGTYTHDFSVQNNNSNQSLSFDIKDPDRYERYVLAMLETLSIECELGDFAMFEAEFIAKRSKAFTSASPSYTDERKFSKPHVKVKVATNIAGLSGASVLSIKNFKLNISKNLIRDSFLGTVQPEDILNRQLAVDGEIVLNFTDNTFRNYMLNGDHKALEFKLDDGTSSLTIQMPRVDFSGWEVDRSNDDIVSQTINFKASYDIANSLDIISTCDLINAKSSY